MSDLKVMNTKSCHMNRCTGIVCTLKLAVLSVVWKVSNVRLKLSIWHVKEHQVTI